MNDSMIVEGFETRCLKVLQVARELHARKPDWITFFRETLGVSGAARSVFPLQEEYVQFEQSKEFTEIQQLVAALRTRKSVSGRNEVTRVITVRLPESLHESLKAEAADHKTSMNKLCISKLLQALIEEEEAQKALAAQAATEASRSPQALPAPHAPQATQQPRPTPNMGSGFRSTYGQ